MSDSIHYGIEPFFLPFGNERIFCIFIAPKIKMAHACVLYLHPFAEEMHKSRRMAALQARQFAIDGYAVLQIDLLGCGDSTGDFEEASWEKWRACAQEGYDWLKKMNLPIILWGLRLGATLAVDVSHQLSRVAGLILWQPVAIGENYLNQFLRIRLASEMLASNKVNNRTQQLRNQITSGESVEIGGYMLASMLATDIDKLRLIDTPPTCSVCWLEVTTILTNSLSPSSLKVIDYWNNFGNNIYTKVIQGEPFWTSQEIIECQELLNQTTKAISVLAR